MTACATRTFVVVAGLALARAPLVAQRVSSDSIPRELAVALLGGTGVIDDLRVGRVPDGFPGELIPAGVMVLASVVRGTESLTILRMPMAVPAALDSSQSRLLRSGWTIAPPAAPAKPLRGFATPPEPIAPGSSTTRQLCHGTTRIRLTPQPQRADTTQLTISLVSGGNGAAACNAAARGYPPSIDNPLLPLLSAPPNSKYDDNAWTGVPTEFNTHARLTTELSAPLVARHLVSQLSAAGWTQVDSSSAGGLEARSFRFSEANGRQWIAILSILTSKEERTMQLFLTGRQK
jgi:hypothetical protein